MATVGTGVESFKHSLEGTNTFHVINLKIAAEFQAPMLKRVATGVVYDHKHFRRYVGPTDQNVEAPGRLKSLGKYVLDKVLVNLKPAHEQFLN